MPKIIYAILAVFAIIAIIILFEAIENLPASIKIRQFLTSTTDIIRIDGSTTTYDFMKKMADTYMSKYPDTIVIVTENSTGEGIKNLLNKEIDIADASRLPNAEELSQAKAKGLDLKTTIIGKDAVAVIIHPSKFEFIKSLTIAQLRAIFFEGTVTDWQQLDPRLSGKINIYVRDPFLSGTASLFIEKVALPSKTSFAPRTQNIPLTPLVVPAIASDINGISFTPLKWINANVSAVAVGQTPETVLLPTAETIAQNKYLLTRHLYAITRSPADKTVQDFLNSINTEQGYNLLKEEGFFLK